jgi:dihydrofolate reductase
MLGGFHDAEHAVGVGVQLAIERFDQRTKRSFVAASGGLHQGLEIVAHGSMSGAPGHRFTTRPHRERPVQMSKVFFLVSVSLDGYLVPPGMDLEHAGDPKHEDWGAQWSKLQSWLLATRFFRKNSGFGDGGDTGIDNEIVERTFARTGTSIMGKRMFDLGEAMWPEDAPFHTPVFVLTKQVRAPWVRPGGTTFHFVNDGIESALRQARAVAGDRDIRIAGGADAIQQYLRAGLADEFTLAISPVLFGGGPRLFAGIDRGVGVELVETIASPRVTHVRYAVRKL